jgi:hypothetical protein
VTSDFYTTLAQVMPLLLLALIWDSAYLDRLRKQRRKLGGAGLDAVRFWTKPRVRAYLLAVAGVVVIMTFVAIGVQARFIPDSFTLRVVLVCGLALVLGTLMYRIYYDVMSATAADADEGKPEKSSST